MIIAVALSDMSKAEELAMQAIIAPINEGLAEPITIEHWCQEQLRSILAGYVSRFVENSDAMVKVREYMAKASLEEMDALAALIPTNGEK